VLALSLALKLAVQDVAVEEDQRAATLALASALASHGYAVTADRPDLPIVQAQRNGCRFTARVLDSHGTYRDTELLKLPRGWTVHYVWRGGIDASLPRIGPLAVYYFARELARVGLAAGRTPVVMLSVQPGCALPDPAALDIALKLRRSARTA
jgi:hypothetical protein